MLAIIVRILTGLRNIQRCNSEICKTELPLDGPQIARPPSAFFSLFLRFLFFCLCFSFFCFLVGSANRSSLKASPKLRALKGLLWARF
jgi:hypothetical protein